jgi:hypothetical protein
MTPVTRILALLALLLALVAASAVADSPWSPLLALRPRHLLAYYPLRSDAKDYAPLGDSDGYQQHGSPRNIPGVADGARMEVSSGLDLPLPLSPRTTPQVTIGAWIQLAEASNSVTGCVRSAPVHRHVWRGDGH